MIGRTAAMTVSARPQRRPLPRAEQLPAHFTKEYHAAKTPRDVAVSLLHSGHPYAADVAKHVLNGSPTEFVDGEPMIHFDHRRGVMQFFKPKLKLSKTPRLSIQTTPQRTVLHLPGNHTTYHYGPEMHALATSALAGDAGAASPERLSKIRASVGGTVGGDGGFKKGGQYVTGPLMPVKHVMRHLRSQPVKLARTDHHKDSFEYNDNPDVQSFAYHGKHYVRVNDFDREMFLHDPDISRAPQTYSRTGNYALYGPFDSERAESLAESISHVVNGHKYHDIDEYDGWHIHDFGHAGHWIGPEDANYMHEMDHGPYSDYRQARQAADDIVRDGLHNHLTHVDGDVWRYSDPRPNGGYHYYAARNLGNLQDDLIRNGPEDREHQRTGRYGEDGWFGPYSSSRQADRIEFPEDEEEYDDDGYVVPDHTSRQRHQYDHTINGKPFSVKFSPSGPDRHELTFTQDGSHEHKKMGVAANSVDTAIRSSIDQHLSEHKPNVVTFSSVDKPGRSRGYLATLLHPDYPFQKHGYIPMARDMGDGRGQFAAVQPGHEHTMPDHEVVTPKVEEKLRKAWPKEKKEKQ